MKKQQLFWAFFYSLVAVVVLYQLNPNSHQYDTSLWPNVLAHIIGGASTGFGALWLGTVLGVFPPYGKRETLIGTVYLRYEKGVPRWMVLTAVVVAAGIAGLGWEVYEVIRWTWVGVQFTSAHISDTLIDLAADLFGALAAGIIAYRYWNA